MINVTIDGKTAAVSESSTIMDAARTLNIDIPNFCYDPDLSATGACRMCVVEVEGSRNLQMACSTPVKPDMVVLTASERLNRARRMNLELLLANHPQDCLTCAKAGECRLQDYCHRYKIKDSRFKGSIRQLEIDKQSHLIERDHNKCILCGKCIQVCHDIQVTGAIDFTGRGFNTLATTPYDLPLDSESCRFCGQCISICPTGALLNRQLADSRTWEIRKVRTTCPLCGTGCNFDLNVKDDRVIGVTPNPKAPVNGNSLCVKGRFHSDLINSPNRVTSPMIKKNGKLVETSWDIALDLVASRFKEIISTDGAKAIAALSSARCTNEENWLMQKFMRAVIGTNNVDHCART